MKYQQPLIACTLFISSITQLVAANDVLSQSIDATIAKQLPHAIVGVLIKDARTGKVIYSKNADKLLSPASCMKLFTAAAAFYQLQPDYQFSTHLSRKDKNVYLTFSGSPEFSSENLSSLLLNLKNTPIKGNLILDTSHFKAPYYASGVSYDDMGWYYTAPDTSAIINGNAVDYEFTTGKQPGTPVRIKAKNNANALTVINQLVTASYQQAKDHCNLNIEIKDKNTLKIFGCLAGDGKPKLMKLAVPDPLLLIMDMTKKILALQHIALSGQVVQGVTPRDSQPIAEHRSNNLAQLVTHMLQESDNLYANSLTKQLAYAVTHEGTYKQGAYAIRKILAEHTPLDMKQIELIDGMGTRYNLVTPEQLVVLLTTIYNNKTLYPLFINALPQAGVSGTLKDRMKKTVLEKNVYAKTGTMHDISSLSGYLITPKKQYIFSIVINGVNVPISKAKTLEEAILMQVM